LAIAFLPSAGVTNAKNQTFQVTFSAGVVEYSQGGTDLQELYRVADAALYQAKAIFLFIGLLFIEKFNI
jgi:GGDEF domain-containing protein